MLQTVPPIYHYPYKLNKKETYTGLKIKDQLKKLEECILNKEIELSITIAFDIILTGNYEIFYQKICEIYITYYNISNINFLEILFNEYYSLIEIKKEIKNELIKLINNQKFRNHIVYLITLLATSKISQITFNTGYLESSTKQYLSLEPFIKYEKINTILRNDNITAENEKLLYSLIYSLEKQHEDLFYKSCSIKNINFDYLLFLWDIILRNSIKLSQDIRKYILICFNLYTKCFNDVRILLFTVFIIINRNFKNNYTIDIQNIIKFQVIINDLLKKKIKINT